MLYVRETGPIGAPAIVLLHGGGLSGRMWQPQIERLSAYHCLVPDLPEHGQSAYISPFTLEGAAQAVATLIRERVPGRKCHVVGLSLGGAVALTLLRIAPETVDHAMISGSAAKLGKVLGTLSIATANIYGLFPPERLISATYRQHRIPLQYQELLHDDLLRSFRPDFTRHWVKALMRMELPRHATVPTLVAVGSQETFLARQAAHTIATALPAARGVCVPGVGHVWNLENPDLFTATLRAWITNTTLAPPLQPL